MIDLHLIPHGPGLTCEHIRIGGGLGQGYETHLTTCRRLPKAIDFRVGSQFRTSHSELICRRHMLLAK